MVEERLGEKQMIQPGTAQRHDSLPEFLDPDRGGGDAANPNLAEIRAILTRSPDAATESLPAADEAGLLLEEDDLRDELRQPRSSKFGLILFGLCIAMIVAGALIISGNEQWVADLKCFLGGDIVKCKMAKVEALQAQWAKEDAATTPRYGDLVLTYFPQDAKVTILQKVTHQQGFDGPMGQTEEILIPNKSHELKENEIVEQLPLVDLPILERERDQEGNIKEVKHYTYTIKIERDGYEPREFTFEPDDWQRLGPDVNWSIAWQGCDLVPKPETIKEPFAKAMREMYCLEQYYEKSGKKAGMTEGDVRGMRKEIEIRHGFKTTAEFENFKTMLVADAAWWVPMWEGIKKEKCPEPEAQP